MFVGQILQRQETINAVDDLISFTAQIIGSKEKQEFFQICHERNYFNGPVERLLAILGFVEYAFSHQEPLDLTVLEPISEVTITSDYEDYKTFMTSITEKILKFKNPSLLQPIVGWISKYSKCETKQEIAAILGILHGLAHESSEILAFYSDHFVTLCQLFLKPQFVNPSRFPVLEAFYDLMRHLLTQQINSNLNFSEIWQDLMLVNRTVHLQQNVSELLKLALKMTWDMTFRASLIQNGKDLQVKDIFLFSTQMSVLLTVFIGDGMDSLCSLVLKDIEDPPLTVEHSLDFYIGSLEGLQIISRYATHLAPEIVKFLMNFMLAPDYIFSQSDEKQCAILRECISQILSGILDEITKSTRESSVLKTTLFTLINYMHSSFKQIMIDNNNQASIKIYENSMTAASNLSRILKPADVVEIVVPALVRRIAESPPEYNSFVWFALGNVGMTFDIQIFRSVIDFVFKGSYSIQEILEISEILASMPQRPTELLVLYLERLLSVFMEKATSYHKIESDAHLSDMRDLCKIIKVVSGHENLSNEILSGNYRYLAHQLRNMWFYLVLFVTDMNGNWPKDWASTVKMIAHKTPPLILEPEDKSLAVNLGADSILIGSFSDIVISRVYQNLRKLIRKPYSIQDVRIIPWEIATYLVTVYHIESLRMKSLSLDYLLHYLIDDRLQGPEVSIAMEAIAEYILRKAFNDPSYKKLSSTVIEKHLRILLLFSAHRHSNVRIFSTLWVKRLLNIVPQFLFNRNLLSFLLNVLSFLDSFSNGTGTSSNTEFAEILKFSSDEEVIESSISYANLCETWIFHALKTCNKQALPILEYYIAELNSSKSWIASQSLKENKVPLLLKLCQKIFENDKYSAPIIRFSAARSKYIGEIRGMLNAIELESPELSEGEIVAKISKQCGKKLKSLYHNSRSPYFTTELYDAIFRAAALVLFSESCEPDLIQLICNAPNVRFDTIVVESTVEVLGWIMAIKPSSVAQIMCQLGQVWDKIAQKKLGIFNVEDSFKNPFEGIMRYGAPCQKTAPDTCKAHLVWVEFLVDRFNYDRLQNVDCLLRYATFILIAFKKEYDVVHNAYAINVRFAIADLGLMTAKELARRGESAAVFVFNVVLEAVVEIFSGAPTFGNVGKEHLDTILRFHQTLSSIDVDGYSSLIDTALLRSAFGFRPSGEKIEPSEVKMLLLFLTEIRIHKLACWVNPLGIENSYGKEFILPPPINEKTVKWSTIVKTAWRINPQVAIHLIGRVPNSADVIENEILECSKNCEIKVVNCPLGSTLFLRGSQKAKMNPQLRHLLYWKPVNPVLAINILSESRMVHPWVLQYAFRSLEDFPVEVVFFYIPQLVQALRHDGYGYIERFILEAAKTSQYFAHQIIWNMEANKFKDEECVVPDSLMPVLERIINKIINNLTGEDKLFYEREFGFFKEVTDISGKLKPLVVAGASKAEKKKKIDEEILKIKVDVGVYLPTNPDRTVAPFMATFKVQNNDELSTREGTSMHAVWMSNIFKVGDDCRQDVLALQLISVFQSIFDSAGIDLYTYSYRVVATAPGCAVIENVPNSISRDMMGREKVNNLYDWFTAKFGAERTLSYKKAQKEFVKSLAGYSLIMFILQFKDRHNGNIMFDLEGHLVHIDFGFMLSIAPGGGLFETQPFKITNEMVQVMGGMVNSPAYTLFCELIVKAYLASRIYAPEIISLISLMMESNLPCFKGEVTIRKLRERFQLDKSDRQATEFMMNCIRQSHETARSGIYDRFQYLQNGIPFK